MQNLINEKEFLRKPYNPWTLFYTFYAIAFMQLIIFFVALTFSAAGADLNTAIVAAVLPVFTAFTMFFSKKKNLLLPFKTLALSAFILYSIYYIPMLGIAFFGGAKDTSLAYGMMLYITNLGMCLLVMHIAARTARSKNASEQEA